MRVLKWFCIILLVLLLPFGVILLTLPLYVNAQVAKADDRWHPDAAVIFWAKFWSVTLSVPFDLILAILLNEGASVSRPLRADELAALRMPEDEEAVGYAVGDMGISRGPSVGPGQVERANVEALWGALPTATRFLFDAETPYKLALKGYERQALWACVSMIKMTLAQASGDKQAAAIRYNGGGHPNSAALAYGQRASDTIDRIGA